MILKRKRYPRSKPWRKRWYTITDLIYEMRKDPVALKSYRLERLKLRLT